MSSSVCTVNLTRHLSVGLPVALSAGDSAPLTRAAHAEHQSVSPLVFIHLFSSSRMQKELRALGQSDVCGYF